MLVGSGCRMVKNVHFLQLNQVRMQFRVRPSSKKSNIDNSLVEFPSKTFITNDAISIRAVNSKIQQLEINMSMLQQYFKKEREVSNTGYIQMQKRLDKMEYKTFAAEHDLKQLNQIRQIKPFRDNISNTQIDNNYSKNQLILFKQAIYQDKEAQKQYVNHQNSVIEQMSVKQMRMEQEIRQLINQQKQEYDYRFMGQADEMRSIESHKQKKIQQQYELMKNMISNAERKIFEELEKKIRNQNNFKEYIEDKIAEVKAEIANQQKSIITTETKYMRQTKQSLESLFSIINTTKKQLADELAETQKLSTSNIKRLSMSLDIVKEKLTEEIREENKGQAELQNQMIQFRNFVTNKMEENRQLMLELEESAMDRIDNQLESSGVSDKNTHGGKMDGQKFSVLQKQMNQWKAITEQKNLNVFKEISNTLKSIKLEWRKENDELVSEVAALNESLKNLKKSMPAELKKSTQAVITIFNNQFDVLAEELDTLTEMIALAKRQNEKFAKEEISKFRNDFYQEIKVLVNQKMKEANSYSEKGVAKSEENNKNALARQSKYLKDLYDKKIESLDNELNKALTNIKKFSLITTSQLEDYSLKLKNFNENYKDYLEEQRKDDMKKRMELQDIMRKNASSLMDLCYKKSQFLVDGLKKNIEMSQMKEKLQTTQALESTRDQLNKNIQITKQDVLKDLSQKTTQITKDREQSELLLKNAVENDILTTKQDLIKNLSEKSMQMTKEREESELAIQNAIDKNIQVTKQDMLKDLNDKALLMTKQREQSQLLLHDTIGKDLTTTKQDFIKNLTERAAQITKERQQSQEVLHDAIELSLNTVKKNMSNELGNAKIEIQEKINQMKVKDVQNQADREEKMIDLKNTVLQMLRDDKKLASEELNLTKKELGDKIIELTNAQKAKQLLVAQKEIQNNKQKTQVSQQVRSVKADIQSIKLKQIENRKDVETLIAAAVIKEKSITNEEIQKTRSELQKKIEALDTSEKKISEEKVKQAASSKAKDQEFNKKISLLQESVDKKIIELQTKEIQSNKQGKQLSTKIDTLKTEIDKKLGDLQQKEAEKLASKENQNKKVGEDEVNKLKTQIKALRQQFDKKINDLKAKQSQQKAEKQNNNKKVGEDELKKLKSEIDQLRKQIQIKLEDLKKSGDNDEQQQAINNVKKSVHKLEAMVFSEQAKNKALFDRLNEDTHNLSQNVALLTNELRDA